MTRAQQSDETKISPLPVGGDEAAKGQSSKGLNPFEEMSRMFDRLSHRNWMQPLHWEWPEWRHIHAPFGGKLPHLDVIERQNEIVLRAELPGVEKKDLDVTMTDHMVRITGKSHYEQKEEKENYFRSEIAHGEFNRTLVLPVDVDVDQAHSTFRNGLLEVIVPKQEKAKRKITIN